jgi:hypothetical protein
MPSNILMKKISAKRFFPMIMVLWGIVVMSLAGVTSKAGILRGRFFLGVPEAGVVPCSVMYFSFWYKPTDGQLGGYFPQCEFSCPGMLWIRRHRNQPRKSMSNCSSALVLILYESNSSTVYMDSSHGNGCSSSKVSFQLSWLHPYIFFSSHSRKHLKRSLNAVRII